MTYDFHYPPQTPEEESDWHEEGKEPKQDLEDYIQNSVNEFNEKVKISNKYSKDLEVIKDNADHMCFHNALNILSDLEIIAKQDKDNCLKARADLFRAIYARYDPDEIKSDKAVSFIVGMATFIPSFLAGMPIALIAEDYKQYEPILVAAALSVCFITPVIAGVGYLIHQIRKDKRELKKLLEADINEYYDKYFRSLKPFENIKLEGKKYNEQKLKKYDGNDIILAAGSIKIHLNRVKKHFKPGDKNDI